ncbi:MAG: glycosyltransferase [Syntrophomonas sp.]
MPGIIIVTPFHKRQRGNSISSSRLQRGLTGKGFKVKLISLEEDNWLSQLQLTVAGGEYDVIHAFHALHLAMILKALPEIREMPLVLTTTGTDINYDLKGAGQDAVLSAFKAVQGIVVFNEYFCEVIKEYFPGAEEKLVTIPQGVALEKKTGKSRSKTGSFENEIVFLLPSGLRPVKNINLAIDALQKVRQKCPAIRLLIMGAAIDDRYSQDITERIAGLDWISYLGEIPHEEMGSWLQVGDVVINSSLSEGQPQGALEAMSLGKPCILTAVPGNLGIIQSGVEGFYVKNEVEMAEAAERLIRDDMLREEMRQAARKLVESRFTAEGELEAYQRLYLEVTREGLH